MRACLVCVVSGIGEPRRERGDRTADASQPRCDEEVEAGTEDPKADDGRQTRGDESFTGPMLSPPGYEVEERRIEIGAIQNGCPGGVEAGQAAEIDGEELVVPEGLERGAEECIEEIESGEQQEADRDPVAGSRGKREAGVRGFRCRR